jgi:hypothetical protein
MTMRTRPVRTVDQVRSLRGLRTPGDAPTVLGRDDAAARSRSRERRIGEAERTSRRVRHERRIEAERED